MCLFGTQTGIPPAAGVIERQYTGSSSYSTHPSVSSPQSVAASLVSSTTSVDVPGLSQMSLRDFIEEEPAELEGSPPPAELDGPMVDSFMTRKMVSMRM